MNENNPLSQFYRAVKFVVRLPSLGQYYEDGIVDTNDDCEVQILPMTARDEMLLKNPDALMSGDAVISLIRSCVPQVKQARKLLACDIDAIMLGIQAASYGEKSELAAKCPECNADNLYAINYNNLLSSTDNLEPHYEIVLSNTVSVFIEPSRFDTAVKIQKAMFEGSKIQRILQDQQLSIDNKTRLFAEAFGKLERTNYEIVIDCIKKAVATDPTTGELIEVTNRKQIADFLENIQSEDVKLIDDKLKEINTFGVQKNLDAVCSSCGHEWVLPIDFNDTTFF